MNPRGNHKLNALEKTYYWDEQTINEKESIQYEHTIQIYTLHLTLTLKGEREPPRTLGKRLIYSLMSTIPSIQPIKHQLVHLP